MKESILLIMAFLLVMAGFFSSGFAGVTGDSVSQGFSAAMSRAPTMHTGYGHLSRADLATLRERGEGDINCDGVIDWSDVSLVAEIAANNRRPERFGADIPRPVVDCYDGSAQSKTNVPKYMKSADLTHDRIVDLADFFQLRKIVKDPAASERIRNDLAGIHNCPIADVGVQTCMFGKLCTCTELFGETNLAAWKCDACQSGSQCVVKGHYDAYCRERTL